MRRIVRGEVVISLFKRGEMRRESEVVGGGFVKEKSDDTAGHTAQIMSSGGIPTIRKGKHWDLEFISTYST